MFDENETLFIYKYSSFTLDLYSLPYWGVLAGLSCLFRGLCIPPPPATKYTSSSLMIQVYIKQEMFVKHVCPTKLKYYCDLWPRNPKFNKLSNSHDQPPYQVRRPLGIEFSSYWSDKVCLQTDRHVQSNIPPLLQCGHNNLNLLKKNIV